MRRSVLEKMLIERCGHCREATCT